MIVNARFSDQLQGGEVRQSAGSGGSPGPPRALPIYHPTYLPIYLSTYLSTYYLPIYLPIYQALILTHTCNQTIPTRPRRIRILNITQNS